MVLRPARLLLLLLTAQAAVQFNTQTHFSLNFFLLIRKRTNDQICNDLFVLVDLTFLATKKREKERKRRITKKNKKDRARKSQ
jgi:hypothetical protein